MESTKAVEPGNPIAAGNHTGQVIQLSSGICLYVLKFVKIPPEGVGLPDVVVLPGLASVYENFHETVEALAERHTVYYLETREKKSSFTSGKTGFSIPEIASDLPETIEKLGLQENGYIIAAYSLGAAVTVSALRHLRRKPKALLLIEPSAAFPWPWWLPPLARSAVPLYPYIKPFLKWYMKKFHINKHGDYEMYEINSRILDQADPKKLARTVVDVAKYEIWDDLATVDVTVLIIGVSLDRFHSHDEASDIAQAIPGSSYIDVETNSRSHSAEVAAIMERFLENVPGKSPEHTLLASS
ncbi:MAG: alpha/beta hydrolase [Bacteroidales bacterium]|jgi:pimeloyl-ACP methyl ester carboxylesterase|nr:alpha/beta hydrolase [Bacteroidales bacterium]